MPPRTNKFEGKGTFGRFELPDGTDDPGRYNLSESTVQSLRLGDLMAMAGGSLDDLAMDYGDPGGSQVLRRLVGDNCGVPAEMVVTVPGTMLGLFLLAAECCGGGGEALLVTPCFGPSRDALERAGARIRVARLHFEEGYQADIARITAGLRHDTRLVCLADPQNPSGVRIPHAAIKALLAEMARHAPQALLFLDETYREATHGGQIAPSAAPLDPRIVTAGSLSKAHGAPGLRIGWLTIADPALRERLIEGKASLIICGSVLDEALAAVLLHQSAMVLAGRCRGLSEALDTVLEWQKDQAHRVEIVRPQAGALCCLRLHPDVVDQSGVDRFWAALPEQHLRLAPGPWFGETSRVFRLGFGHLRPGELRAALPALSRALDHAA